MKKQPWLYDNSRMKNTTSTNEEPTCGSLKPGALFAGFNIYYNNVTSPEPVARAGDPTLSQHCYAKLKTL